MGLIGDKIDDYITSAKQTSLLEIKDRQMLGALANRREEYMKSFNDQLPEQHKEHVDAILGNIGIEVYHAYLSQLKDIYTPFKTGTKFIKRNRICTFDITKWVWSKDENALDKLINVYHVLCHENCNIALIFDRTPESVTISFAIANTDPVHNDPKTTSDYLQLLIDAIKGNFPGAVIIQNEPNSSDTKDESTLPSALKTSALKLKTDKPKDVSIVSNIATTKSEKFISQGIEKLLDGIVPSNEDDSYSIVLLASPVQDAIGWRNHLCQMSSNLSPFANGQTNYTITDSENEAGTISRGINLGGGIGLSVKPFGVGVNAHANFGLNYSSSSSSSYTISETKGVTKNWKDQIITQTLQHLEMQIKRIDQSSALGLWNFAAYFISNSWVTTKHVASMYLALTQGETSYISAAPINTWKATTEREHVVRILESLQCLQHPIFILDPDQKYDQSIKEISGNSKGEAVCADSKLTTDKSLLPNDDRWLMYPSLVNATNMVTGSELAYSMNLPRKSVSGIPVITCAEFGRNISVFNQTNHEVSENTIEHNFYLGKIVHMHHEEKLPVVLSKKSLTSHTFITGSTGSGKSNTVYQLIVNSLNNSIPFLVIEPAKGEYKHAFSSQSSIWSLVANGDQIKKELKIYGTNPYKTELLRLNPFSFHSNCHVLEHIDRLIEIFNVCWPMYAAMPAVLKNAVEKSYEDCGWNLKESTNIYGNRLFPCFADVARNIKDIIDTSEYDNENKGAYKGSLLTRLQSLTNGINGMIFVNDEIDADELFNSNVIIDLSRVGSTETKSLLMGILVLKLQEHRMSPRGFVSELKHITILEEAHHLLKRVSSYQSGDGGNLIGKSVEMLSNAIAEMRSFGEGFIIADQAPGLLDASIIRNTNTKIVLRLPDQSDRELVGKSMGLNDDQIIELSKLPCGVAAIYQNEWIQAVLCQVNEIKLNNNVFSYKARKVNPCTVDFNKRIRIASLLSSSNPVSLEAEFKAIIQLLSEMHLTSFSYVSVLRRLRSPSAEPRMTKLAPIFCELFPEIKAVVKQAYYDNNSPHTWTDRAKEALTENLSAQLIEDQVRRDIIQAVITGVIYNELNRIDDLERWSKEGRL